MAVAKEQLADIKVGDRLPDSWLGTGWTVVGTKRAREGAIEIRNDTPEFAERVRKALEMYREAVRRDMFGPWTIEEIEEMERRRKLERDLDNMVFDSPI